MPGNPNDPHFGSRDQSRSAATPSTGAVNWSPQRQAANPAALTISQAAHLAGIRNFDPNNRAHVQAAQAYIQREQTSLEQRSAEQARLTWQDPTAVAPRGAFDTSRNYVYRSADGKTDVAFAADPTQLSHRDFEVDATGGIASRMRNVGQDLRSQAATAQQRDTIRVSNALRNSGESRAMLAATLAQEGPSAAEAMLQSGQEASMRQALALARSGRGQGGQAAALGQASFQNSQAQAQLGQQVAALRAQESQQHRQALAQFAGLDQSALGQAYGARGQSDQLALGLRGAELSSYGQQAALSQSAQQARADRAKTQMAADVGVNTQNASFANYREQPRDSSGAIAGAISGIAGAAAMALSDERSKQKIRELEEERDGLQQAVQTVATNNPFNDAIMNTASALRAGIGRFQAGQSRALGQASGEAAAAAALRAAPGRAYEYKDPSTPGAKPGAQFGPMAQDLEKTPVGRSLVSEGPDGMKRVDTDRLALVNAAATSDTARRLDEVQAQADEMTRRLEALGAPPRTGLDAIDPNEMSRQIEALRGTRSLMPKPSTPSWLTRGAR